MKTALAYIGRSLGAGLLVVVPVYLALLLLLKGMKSVAGLVRPFARLLPEWLPAEQVLSLLLVLVFCFLLGALINNPAGRDLRQRLEQRFFERIPGYALVRGLTQQLSGQARGSEWKPA